MYFEEDEGIIQVEHFGVHLDHDGSTMLGLKIEALLDRDKHRISNLKRTTKGGLWCKWGVSLDHLARILADIHQVCS